MTYLVCGEALFDCFLEDSDNPGVVRLDARVGGSPFNVAVGISRLGGRASLLTGISTDMLGERLVRVLESESVGTSYLVRSDRQTTLSLVGVDAAGRPCYDFYGLESADRSVTEAALPDIGSEIAGIHVGSYSLVVSPVADAFSALVASAGDRFVSVDPNVRTTVEPDLDIWRARVSEYARVADLLKISSEDMETLYPGAAFEAKAADWLDAGVTLVIVTDGVDDVRAWTRSGNQIRRSPPRLDIVDTVGAGDSFQSALLARLAEAGDPRAGVRALDAARLEDLVDYAISAAAITCSRRGADLPRRDEIPARSG